MGSSQLNDSARIDLMADLIIGNHQLLRLGRIKKLCEELDDQNCWIYEAMAALEALDWNRAYELWQANYDCLNDLLGQFADILHQSYRPRQVSEEVRDLRDRLAKSFVRNDGRKLSDILREVPVSDRVAK